MSKVRVRDRGVPHCPLCRVTFGGTVQLYVCEGCNTQYHHDCADELGGCATLGCPRLGVGPEESTPADQRWRARARRYRSGARDRRESARRLREEHIQQAAAEGVTVWTVLEGGLLLLDCLSCLALFCVLLASGLTLAITAS